MCSVIERNVLLVWELVTDSQIRPRGTCHHLDNCLSVSLILHHYWTLLFPLLDETGFMFGCVFYDVVLC